jgi:hypothetical protein
MLSERMRHAFAALIFKPHFSMDHRVKPGGDEGRDARVPAWLFQSSLPDLT